MARNPNNRNKKPFFMYYTDLLRSEKYCQLSYVARTLIPEFGLQYNGDNNGDLCIAYSLMKKRGFGSPNTVRVATNELVDAGFIERTKQGGRTSPNLYAVTWHAIDHCGGKLDTPPTRTPSNKWKD